MSKPGWTCLKCQHDEYESDTLAVTGTGWSKLLDIQNRRFTTLTCTRCHFTELYKGSADQVRDILDLLFGG